MNVNNIHNTSVCFASSFARSVLIPLQFAAAVNDQQLEQIRSLANYRENGIFAGAALGDIENGKFSVQVEQQMVVNVLNSCWTNCLA